MDIPIAESVPIGLALSAMLFTWKVSSQVSALKTQHDLLWTQFMAKLAIDTHKDTKDPEEMRYDELVEKFVHKTITEEEMIEFKRRLRGLAQRETPDGLTAKILLSSMEERQKQKRGLLDRLFGRHVNAN
jgi:hypothetical protein